MSQAAEVVFGGGLAGTLTMPAGAGPFPAAVLLTGSGPMDRDGNYKKLRLDVSRQLAAALAEVGVASLRYDKRGVGASRSATDNSAAGGDVAIATPAPDNSAAAGDWRRVGFFDNVDDAAAAVDFLRARASAPVGSGVEAAAGQRAELRGDALFVIGHSEGALLATALAGRGVPLAGIVLLAGTARTGEEVMAWQAGQIAPTLPRPVRLLLRLFRIDLVTRVRRNHAKIKATTTDVARVDGAKVNARWLREFMAYSPLGDLERSVVPLLAITGEKDLQVPADDLAAIAAAARGPVETHRVPDLTHTLRRQEGAPSLSRYKEELRRPVDPQVLATVTRWVRAAAR